MNFEATKKGRAIFFAMALLIACIVFSNNNIQLAHPTAYDFVVPCKIDTYGPAWDGYLAYGLWFFNSSLPFPGIGPAYLVVMGTNGQLVYLRQSNDWSYWIATYQSEDTLMFQGEPESSVHFLNLRTNQTVDVANVFGHHDVIYDPVDNTFLTLQDYVKRVNGIDVLFDKILELDAKGNVLWSWDTYDHIPLSEVCPFNDTWPVNGENAMDLTHANSIQWDYKENIVYLNIRNVNTFYKINMTTGNIVWACGEFGNFTLLDAQNGQKVLKPTVNGASISTLWYHGHCVREVEPDVFIMFDNDYHNQTNPNDNHSRIIEVTLDEKNMTAWISWSWTAPEDYFASWGGKADRLPNGDRIGTFASNTHPIANSTGAVLIEVNPKGQVVRTYTFPFNWGIYRITEIPLETFNDYDGLWRGTDFHVKLAAANDLGGLSDIYYKINGGPTKAVNTDGQPHITEESANNTLEYWSVDSGGLEESPHKTLTGIKLDETPPNISITSPLNGSEIKTSNATVTWTGSDETSGISHYEIELDTGLWTSTGTNTTYVFNGLSDGNHTIGIRALDVAGNDRTLSANFTMKLDKTPPNISITSPLNGSEIKTSNATVTWTGSDESSGISHYEIELDTGLWTSTGTNTTYTFNGLSDGNHTIGIRALDMAGNERTLSVNFTINTSSTVQPNWIYGIIVVTLVAAAIVVAVIYTLRTRKHRKT